MFYSWTDNPNIPTSAETFYGFVSQNSAWDWWAKDLQYSEQDILVLANEIGRGLGFAVSDGSFKDQHGMASTVLEASTGLQRITTSVITPGRPEDQCAYRSEAAGILTTIQLVNTLRKYTRTRGGQCIMGCNGKSALTQCFWKGSRSPTEIPHFDIIAQVRQEIAISPFVWRELYIPGHQTDPTDCGANLNNEMDEACKKHWSNTTNDQQQWFTSSWSVWTGGFKVVSNLTHNIREHCSIQRAERYWKRKAEEQFPDMDWTGIKAITKTIPRHRQQWITKHVSGFCSVGKMAKRIGLQNSDACPHCDEV
jgi:hypothetical protein